MFCIQVAEIVQVTMADLSAGSSDDNVTRTWAMNGSWVDGYTNL